MDKKGCPISLETYAWAAKWYKLDVLQWLRKHNHTWDEYTLMESVR